MLPKASWQRALPSVSPTILWEHRILRLHVDEIWLSAELSSIIRCGLIQPAATVDVRLSLRFPVARRFCRDGL